jgi:hypothetical protein
MSGKGIELEGEDLTGLPLSERKARLATVMIGGGPPLQYSDHQVGRGTIFYVEACKFEIPRGLAHIWERSFWPTTTMRVG